MQTEIYLITSSDLLCKKHEEKQDSVILLPRMRTLGIGIQRIYVLTNVQTNFSNLLGQFILFCSKLPNFLCSFYK